MNRELDIANYEDIVHLSSIWSAPELANVDIRHSSSLLRRLLIHKDIIGSAAPRSIRLLITSPDNKPLVRAATNGYLDFFQSAGTTALGVWVGGLWVGKNQRALQGALREFNPDARIPLKLDSFLDQPVFFFRGTLVTRRTVLLYVANKAAGSHFDSVRPHEFEVLDRVRAAVSMKLIDGIPSFGFNVDAIHAVNSNFVPTGEGIDPVFIELAAAVRYLVESDSVRALIQALKDDLGL